MAHRPTRLGVTTLALLAAACGNAAPSVQPTSVTPARSVEVSPSPQSRAPRTWTGPVRGDDGTTLVEPMSWNPGEGWYEGDPDDAQRPYADITEVVVSSIDQPHWRLRLAIVPPKADELDPAETVITYGLTYDRDIDGIADYVVGISNEAPVAGEFRVWVSDLATGETREQVGPPYGYPVEFAHPDESPGGLQLPEMVFTFVPGSRRGAVHHQTRFYTWASVSEGGEVVAWDYAPDVGWLSTSQDPNDSTSKPTAQPTPAGSVSSEMAPLPWAGGLGELPEPGRRYGWPGSPSANVLSFILPAGWMPGTDRFLTRNSVTLEFSGGLDTFYVPGRVADIDPVEVTIAGYEGLLFELPSRPDGGERREWMLHIDDSWVNIDLEIGPEATSAEVEEAMSVLESLRAE
jgi:hypothetical protein